MMERQLFGATSGLTQASSVMPVVRSSTFASLTVTRSFVPSKFRAAPYRPLADHAAPEMAPLLPLPVRSAVDTPASSSKP